MKVRFSVGIDLGTSNSAIAVSDIQSGDTEIVEIGQIVGPNQLGQLPTLPSAIYVPHREEFPEGSFPLPWNDAGEPAIVGQFARDRGALVPDRLVTSAKSWLSNPHIDPKPPILPAVRHHRRTLTLRMLAPLSPASQKPLLFAERSQGRDWDLSECQIVVTVPASFDEVARSLTAGAAKAAGLGDVTLLEEPQAALLFGRSKRAERGATWLLTAISCWSAMSVAGHPISA